MGRNEGEGGQDCGVGAAIDLRCWRRPEGRRQRRRA